MPLVHINIGTNQGDRLGNISRAVALISLYAGIVTAAGPVVESEPWGYDSPNRYLNTGINLYTALAPHRLLDTLQLIEKTISTVPHRNTDGTYRDRAIDIDIILYADALINTPRLTVPHPRMHLRPFVIEPLKAIWPRQIPNIK